MAKPQQPELARSRKTPSQDPDSAAALTDAPGGLETTEPRGPVPPENQPGHHPEREQDKPDLDQFSAKLSGDDAASAAGAARPDPSPKGKGGARWAELALLPVRASLAVVRDVRECLSRVRSSGGGSRGAR